jgi:hypothetical protein
MEFKHPFGKAPYNTRVCPRCIFGNVVYGKEVLPLPLSAQSYRAWCSVARCPVCEHEWFVCKECPGVRTLMESKVQIKNHSFKFHGTKQKPRADGNEGIAHRSTGRLPTVDAPSTTVNSRRIVVKRKIASTADGPYHLARTNIQSVGRLSEINYPIDLDGPDSNTADHWMDDNSLEIDHMNDETPSRIYGGIPNSVKACHFSRQESQNYFGNNYHAPHGVAYMSFPNPFIRITALPTTSRKTI